MRRNIVHVGAASLSYEIREIVAVAREVGKMGREIVWENIGDPVQNRELPPAWIRDIIHDLIELPERWGNCETAGVPATREFLAGHVNARPGGVQITSDDIMFFNGLGDAVAKVYGFLRREARILGPSPAYSTHSSAEAAHSGYNHVTYQLDPYNGWLPDVDDIRNKVKYNDSIAGILLLTPDNPTGAVYPRELLEEIAQIAREHKLFVISDEIYAHIVYNGNPRMHMSEWIGDVPALAMRGISKEYPWPGSRCGWLEILNKDKDDNFATYVNSILAAKRLEVSSTTLPQMSIPKVIGDDRYVGHLKGREAVFDGRADEAMAAFADCEAVICNKPGGAFYFTLMFKPGVLNNRQRLQIDNAAIRERIEHLVPNVAPDKRFVYYLMGATGIVVVPLSGFQCSHDGFRMTLLESDEKKRAWIFKTVRESIDAYLSS
ncbi:MAG: pyridoxal phosphate-dependent aminotransferase [Candidatus Hydrogenedentes bacterium]|nr:pyridoxal phosphate-dependent aminotransferase [Candidatus Hydrogenedentota bacterium]